MPLIDTRPLFLTNGRIVDPASGRDERGGVFVENGVIRDVGPAVSASAAPPVPKSSTARGW